GRRKLVRRGRGHEHQIRLGGGDASALERGPRRGGGVVGEPLFGAGLAALPDAGAREDPLLAHPELLRELLVGDATGWELDRDRQNLRVSWWRQTARVELFGCRLSGIKH